MMSVKVEGEAVRGSVKVKTQAALIVRLKRWSRSEGRVRGANGGSLDHHLKENQQVVSGHQSEVTHSKQSKKQSLPEGLHAHGCSAGSAPPQSESKLLPVI